LNLGTVLEFNLLAEGAMEIHWRGGEQVEFEDRPQIQLPLGFSFQWRSQAQAVFTTLSRSE